MQVDTTVMCSSNIQYEVGLLSNDLNQQLVFTDSQQGKPDNCDKGSYQLSHAYVHFLDETADRHIKIRKN